MNWAKSTGKKFLEVPRSVPSIFLEDPTWESFEKEVRKGYEFVGISFFATCMDIVLDMCKLVRRLSPQSKIVLGHYGALAFNAFYPEDFKKEYEVMSYYILAKALQAKVQESADSRNRHPKEEPFKVYIYDKNGRGRDSPPYKVIYPIRDRAYEGYRDIREIKEGAFGKALKWLDQIVAPEGFEAEALNVKTKVL